MGDVALLVPVIRSLVQTHANVEITIATRPRFAPFFHGLEGVTVFPADVDNTYKGIFGMADLFKALTRRASYDIVIDLHDHLRTKILRALFKLFFTDVIVFSKGRKEKRAFTRKTNKITRPLPHTVERYREAFTRAGFSFSILPPPHFQLNESIEQAAAGWLQNNVPTKSETWIGLAPFAMHATKIWPLENYPPLIEKILEKTSARFFLFGGGDQEIRYFEHLKERFPGVCVVVAGQLKISEEIALMKQLDVMFCVDSSNMHVAALAGTPLLSVWGGTHPDVGFAPLGDHSTVIQITPNELPCRPCSVYGRETCYVGGFPCLTRITPALIAEKVLAKVAPNR